MNQKENNEEQKQQLKIASKKFLKVYMLTFFAFVTILISLSYFAQEKLTKQIEVLNTKINSTEQENIKALNNVEKLQTLTNDQEKLLKEQQDKLKLLDNIDKRAVGLDKFWRLQKLYYTEDFEKCVLYVEDIYVNYYDFFTDEVKKEFDRIKDDIISKELTTAEKLDELKNQIDNEKTEGEN